MIHTIATHVQQPSVVVADVNDAHLVGVGQGWLSTAFECAVGNTIEEVLTRFSDELRATLDAHEADSARLGSDECLALVRRIQVRMCIAAEWAERLTAMTNELQERKSEAAR